MTREHALRSAALDMLRKLEALDKKHAAYVAALRELQPGIGVVSPLPGDLETEIVGLVDMILGADEIAAYLRWEARGMQGGGAVISADDHGYPIRTVADVAAYLDAEHPLGD